MKPRSAHDGFAALAAIFLMVVLGALGAFMLSFSSIQHSTSAQDIQGSRAYWAARAGLEWGLANFASACPFTLFGFGVTVTCSLTGYAESTPTPTIPNVFVYQIDAVAKSSTAIGSQGYFERSVSASMER
jgi:MSHA biogenesis protein MshP